MDEPDSNGPFKKPDNGVSFYGEPNPWQAVQPPASTNEPPVNPDGEAYPEESTDTEPLEVIDVEDDDAESSDDTVYFFRRSIRDVLSRLFSRRKAPKAYLLLLYGGLIAIVAPAVISSLVPNYPLHGEVMVAGILLLGYPIAREVYRWRKRTVLMVKTARGMHITYHQPAKIILGFTGTGDGDTAFIEGSVATSMQTDWLNRLIFWGCGTIIISAKIEADKAHFDNIPRVKELQAFLS